MNAGWAGRLKPLKSIGREAGTSYSQPGSVPVFGHETQQPTYSCEKGLSTHTAAQVLLGAADSRWPT